MHFNVHLFSSSVVDLCTTVHMHFVIHYTFLPRDASAERGDATVSRPSVRLWRLGISNT